MGTGRKSKSSLSATESLRFSQGSLTKSTDDISVQHAGDKWPEITGELG